MTEIAHQTIKLGHMQDHQRSWSLINSAIAATCVIQVGVHTAIGGNSLSPSALHALTLSCLESRPGYSSYPMPESESLLSPLYEDDRLIYTDLPPLYFEEWSAATDSPVNSEWATFVERSCALVGSNVRPVAIKMRKPFDPESSVSSRSLSSRAPDRSTVASGHGDASR